MLGEECRKTERLHYGMAVCAGWSYRCLSRLVDGFVVCFG